MKTMRSWTILAATVAVAAVVATLRWEPTSRSRAPVARERDEARPATLRRDHDSESVPGEPATADATADRGIVRGRLTYEDGSPAAGLPVTLQYGHFPTTTDNAGEFRIDAPSGEHALYLGLLELEEFELRPRQEHVAEHVVPRGAVVSGSVVAAEDGRPLGRLWPWLYGSRLSEMTFTREDGTFMFGWVPSGTYHLVVPDSGPRRRTEVAVFTVESADIVVRIEAAEAPPLRVRLENLPAEWLKTVPLYIEIRDEAGHPHTVPPSDAIGGPHGPFETSVDPTGYVLYAPPVPIPGRYMLSLLHMAWDTPYLEVPFESPACVDNEIVVRIPDGARLVVTHPGDVRLPWGRLSGLVVGTSFGNFGDAAERVVFPRVSAGRQTIWKTNTWSVVRVGEVEIPGSGEASYTIDSDLGARIEGASRGERNVRLHREGDGLLVAWKREGSPQIAFGALAPGRYTLLVDDRRIPIELAIRQVIDFGDEFAR